MKKMKKPLKIFLVLLMCIFSFGFLFGQYREYHLFGLVVDSQQQPLAGVELFLQDVNTSRNYRVKTDKNGKYVLSGLPHGRYRVTVKKDGYETRTFDWDFSAPQERMQKVEMETIVLASEQQVKLATRAKEAQQAVNESMEKIKKGDLEGALKILSELARDYPDDSNVRYLLGLTYGRLQRYQEAVAELTRVTELVPEFAPAYLQLGYCYQSLNDQDKALEYYKKAAELDPSNPANLYNLGLILFEKNQIDEAQGYFERALAIKADDADTLEMIGRCYVNKGDLPRALEFLEKARGLTTDEEKIKILDKFIATLKEQIKK
ncbi:MAG TPA: tetratricopeptide repeat protein [Candidatus Saccharicenans sp.]|jgi:tetratricopeptide (TPR) repeat protein|nr:tetratricopeptide repeat protein [Candidatus Saccharicenans sp.]